MISIHALLAESDIGCLLVAVRLMVFLSTLSLRRATFARVGRLQIVFNFYPRSPCGERHLRVVDGSKSSIISIHALLAESDPPRVIREPTTARFLSTLSLRRATTVEIVIIIVHAISIHALLAESDVKLFRQNYECFISIHALLAESD